MVKCHPLNKSVNVAARTDIELYFAEVRFHYMHGLPKNSDVALIIKWAWSRALLADFGGRGGLCGATFGNGATAFLHVVGNPCHLRWQYGSFKMRLVRVW